MEGTVFDVSRYCLDDGPGIRTTVFLKGCPLHCTWCHNPESLSRSIEIGFDEEKCVNCGACVQACSNGAHKMINGKHAFDRSKSEGCTACVEACEYGALTMIGKKMSVEDVMKIVERDRPFYNSSGGGMTVSGGECLYQPVFTESLLSEAKKRGISTCIETSGYASSKKLRELAKYVDIFLFDCKQMNSATHQEVTGVSNELILNNLKMLDCLSKKIVLRLPIIPGINNEEEHFRGVGELADSLAHVLYLEVLPYHPLGLSKAALIQRKMPYEATEIPKSETVNQWVTEIQKYTKKQVIRSKS